MNANELTSRTRIQGAICLLLAAGTALVLVVRHRLLTDLRNENISLREQTEELHRLRAENDRLAIRIQSPGVVRLSSEESRELLRLRAEVGRLRSQLADMKDDTRSNRWSYAGAHTPEAAVESLLWALANTNYNQATGALHLEVTGLISPFTPQQVQDSIPGRIGWDLMGPWISNLRSLEIMSSAPVGNDELMLKLWQTMFDGNKRSVFARARRVDNEWKFVGKWEVLELNSAGGVERMRISLPFVSTPQEEWHVAQSP